MAYAIADKRWLVLGLGDTGLSLSRWLLRHGAKVRVADTRDNPPHAAKLGRDFPSVDLISGPYQLSTFADIDGIAISPGVPMSEAPVMAAVAKGIPVVGDVELFGQAIATAADRPKVIGITGSNGKSTVTTMVGEMCKAAGLNTVIAGNIGLPVLDALAEAEQAGGTSKPQCYVLELSSFQLETTSSLDLDAATVLNVTEDHLDRYDDMDHYASAKARIFSRCRHQVLNREDRYSVAMKSSGNSVSYFARYAPLGPSHFGLSSVRGESWLAHDQMPLMAVADLPLAGGHNVANALAALALARAIDLPYPPIIEALRRFRGLPHRVEKVMDIGTVGFYDDSKGTNVGATVAALNGMKEKVVLIAGGDGKAQDFSPLNDAVAKHARAVVLIGRDAKLIEMAIAASGVAISHANSMDEAVKLSWQASEPGDRVLLSPACASFDMFNNYAHRAQVFIDAVRALAAAQRSVSNGAV
jgi:UDP-N-acetylmuramoylalanine--D-glutamate ligase